MAATRVYGIRTPSIRAHLRSISSYLPFSKRHNRKKGESKGKGKGTPVLK
jgi:hypothetical protein